MFLVNKPYFIRLHIVFDNTIMTYFWQISNVPYSNKQLWPKYYWSRCNQRQMWIINFQTWKLNIHTMSILCELIIQIKIYLYPLFKEVCFFMILRHFITLGREGSLQSRRVRNEELRGSVSFSRISTWSDSSPQWGQKCFPWRKTWQEAWKWCTARVSPRHWRNEPWKHGNG